MLDEQLEQEVTQPGKGLDLSFIGNPHEHDPRRVYSTTATDWQARVDFDRLRPDRLARARLMASESPSWLTGVTIDVAGGGVML